MIFRSVPAEEKPTPEQMQANMKRWQDWIAGIAAQGKLVGTNRLGTEGRTIKPNKVVINGPYAEVKEIIGGYLLLKADSIDEASKMAEGCPIFLSGGHVEIRDVPPMNM